MVDPNGVRVGGDIAQGKQAVCADLGGARENRRSGLRGVGGGEDENDGLNGVVDGIRGAAGKTGVKPFELNDAGRGERRLRPARPRQASQQKRRKQEQCANGER